MNLSQGFLDELRSRTSLARLAARKVSWDNRKSNSARGDFWAPCPFHQERSASFHIDEAKGFYYCFGCHAKGDAISFLRETENMGFMEAVETLARDAGLPLPDRPPEQHEARDRRTRLHAVMDAAVAFYRLQLSTARAAEARAYLDARGLAVPTRDRFEIGWAPDARDSLARHLEGRGFAPDELLDAGLTKAPDDGGTPYDRFRARIIFPICDARGRPVALGGRSLDPKARAKYLNSPETPLFDKGRTLFNLKNARAAAGRSGQLIVVEGYMDAIALVQAGYEGAVAPLGTAITEDQLDQIWRIAPEPLVALDGDTAGLGAAQRLIDLALPRLVAGRSLRFILLPADHDPDDVLRTGGRPAMDRLIEASQPIVELVWRRETEGRSLDSPERRAALEARLRAHLGRIADERLRAHTAAAFRDRCARAFAVVAVDRPARNAGSARLSRSVSRGQARLPQPVAASAAAKSSLLAQSLGGAAAEARVRESAILLGLVNHPSLARAFEDRLDRMVFVCPDLGEIRDALLFCLHEALGQGIEPEAGGSAGVPGLAAGQSRKTLTDALARRLGRDPTDRLAALGQVRANPHLRADAEPARATLAVEEEMIRHAAWMDKEAELHEAMEALAAVGEADEGLTWRLRQAAEARDRAARDPLSDELPDTEGDADMSRRLQDLIDRQVWKRSRETR